ncbi:MAG: T9SS type A sorting domain-containing protein [Bacteroidota bacterium]
MLSAGFVPTPADAQDIRIVRVDPETNTVTIKNLGTTSADISDFWLCVRPQYDRIGESGSVAVVSGDLTLGADEEVVLDVSPAGASGGFTPITSLEANSELGLFATSTFGSTDPAVLLDFVTWGGITASTRVGQAVTAGRWDDANTTVAGAGPYTFLGSAGEFGADFWVSDTEIRMTRIIPESDIVILENADTVALDISGFWFCTIAGIYPQVSNPDDVEVLEGDLMLDPGERVALRILTPDGIVDEAGSLFLFSTALLGFNNGNPASVRDFAQWDAPNGFRVENAVAAGRWEDAGNFIEGVAPYFIDEVAPGSFTSDQWSAKTSAVRITNVDPANDQVTLKNFGTEEIDITGYWFCLAVGQYEEVTGADLVLSPDEEIVVVVSTGLAVGEADNLGLFSTNTFGSSNPDVYVDFVQWVGRDDRGRPGQAVFAGVWDSSDAFVDGDAPYVFTGSAGTYGSTHWEPAAVTSQESATVPDGFALFAAYPNPFNPQTTITYELGARADVRLAVYDLLGREVAVLIDNEQQAAGSFTVRFAAGDLPSGTYLYRLTAGAFSQTATMQLLR